MATNPLDFFEPQPEEHRLLSPFVRMPAEAPGGAVGAFVRRGLRQALPTAAGVMAYPLGAQGGAGLGTAAAGPVGGFVGGVGGGLLAATGASMAVNKAQDWLFDQLDDGTRKLLGVDPDTVAADEYYHPQASFIGGLAPQLAFMRPGWNGAAAAAAGGTIGAGVEAGSELADNGKIDPFKVAAQAALGATLGKNTRLGDVVQTPAEALIRAIPRGSGATAAGLGAQTTVGEMPPGIPPEHQTPDEQAAFHVNDSEGFVHSTNPYGAGRIWHA
jgi:hypothetical protein